MNPKLRNVPTAVYRLYDVEGQLLYIGVTNQPKARWYNHKRERDWWPKVVRKDFEWHATREDAKAAEKAAIRAEKPRYNTTYHPEREPEFLERLRRTSLATPGLDCRTRERILNLTDISHRK